MAWDDGLVNHPDHRPWDYQFRDLGISGRQKHKTKGSLLNYLEQAEKGLIPEVTVLVAEKPSRLTRKKPGEALRLIQRFLI